MVNRRYALLGWMVWRVSKLVAKRRAKAMVASAGRSNRLVALAPVLAAAAGAAWLFLRHHDREQDADRVG